MSYVYWCAVLSAIFAGLVPILAKVGLDGVNSNLATTVRVLMLAPILCGLVIWQKTGGAVFSFTSKNWLFLFLSALATGLSWLFYFYALSKKDATWVAPIDKSSLAFTFILAVVFLGEAVTWQKVVATLLVLAALGVTMIPSANADKPADAPAPAARP